MSPVDIQDSRSKVNPILHMLGKGGICVFQTAIFIAEIGHIVISMNMI